MIKPEEFRELEMLKIVRNSGYRGTVGILDHRQELDAEVSLRKILSGSGSFCGK